MINVTKAFLPSFEEYTDILRRAWDISWITNNGLLLQELEQKLKEYLPVPNLLFTSNGTVVIQMALKALDITKEVITTPFSYVATTNAILWEGCRPVFVDIDPLTFCIDADKIEAAITKDTQAIMATHVYGIPCDVEKIRAVAEKYHLKVIYDAAHAFGCTIDNRSLLDHGDISTCSFHATKIFHTVEGGCVICPDKELNDKLYLLRSFGHIGDDYYSIGINGKNSEFHAAMGLANLKYVPEIIDQRKELSQYYDIQLSSLNITRPYIAPNINYNYAYYPVVFEKEEILLKVVSALNEVSVKPRRYFYPSLNKLPFVFNASSLPVSESISNRVLCLPLYFGLPVADIELISGIIKKVLL